MPNTQPKMKFFCSSDRLVQIMTYPRRTTADQYGLLIDSDLHLTVLIGSCLV